MCAARSRRAPPWSLHGRVLRGGEDVDGVERERRLSPPARGRPDGTGPIQLRRQPRSDHRPAQQRGAANRRERSRQRRRASPALTVSLAGPCSPAVGRPATAAGGRRTDVGKAVRAREAGRAVVVETDMVRDPRRHLPDGLRQHYPEESPPTRVTVDGFWIDAHAGHQRAVRALRRGHRPRHLRRAPAGRRATIPAPCPTC